MLWSIEHLQQSPYLKTEHAMTKEERRRQVIGACIAHQQHIAATAQKERDSAQQQSNEYGQNVDRYDSFRTKMMRNRDMYAHQLANANASLRCLQDLLKQPVMDYADHGATVITDKQRLFLSVGAGQFMVPFSATLQQTQEPYFAISAQVPIYQMLHGKHAGDSFTFNNITYKI